MLRTFLTVWSILLLVSYSSGQVFKGAMAQQKIKGAEILRYTNGNPLPAYVQLAPQSRVAESEGIDYLTKHLRLSADITFELLEVTTDKLGFTHYRYQQKIKDIPVYAGIYLLHCRNGQVVSMNGHLFKQPIQMPARPSLSTDEAIALALQYLPATRYGWEVTAPLTEKPISAYPQPELVWVAQDLDYQNPSFRLAYRLDIYAMQPLQRAWVYVDAETGMIIAAENRICQVDEPGTAVTTLSGERGIIADRVAGNQVRLRESGRGDGIVTLNMQNTTDFEVAIDFEDDDNFWNNVNANLDETATDVHWAVEQYFDYLLAAHNRLSIDDNGATLLSYLHFGTAYGNAFWDGTACSFGDGNPSGTLNLPVVNLEIVAHEFTHGLTEFSAGLIVQNESGALNESFSDIFGAATDFFARPEVANWLVAEESTVGGLGIRSFSDPQFFEHPDTYLGDFFQVGGNDGGGIHKNSGVMNYWFYLLSEGGSGINDRLDEYDIDGIGWEKAMQIVYRNLTVYLTPSAAYDDAAFYANLAAMDLFGACSNEHLQTNNAWYAVGLADYQGSVTVADFNAQQLYCELPAEVQFFNNSSWSPGTFWDFGDGQTSTENSPLHEYTEPGAYTIRLITTGCDGLIDTLNRSSFIVVDTTNVYCDTLHMQFIGEQTISNCTGVILDPGGSGDYPNGSYTILTIAPPGSSPIQLEFVEFSTQLGSDRINIYDGPDVHAPRIATFEGNLGLGQTLLATSGQVTLEFLSNGSVTFPGFVINYNTTGGLSTPIAGFEVNNLNPPLLLPLHFTDESDPGGLIEWDFGDGTLSTQRNPIHSYTAPGTYVVAQTINNCFGQDTSTQEIIVQESGSISWSPDSICVTLFSGESLDTSVFIQNQGPGDLYYHLVAPQAQVEAHQIIEYTTSGATTHHVFEGLSMTLQELALTLVLNGDYDDTLEFTQLYIEGQFIEDIVDENPANGTDIVKVYHFDETTIAPWLADGMLEIELVNSPMVSVGFDGSDSHRVMIEGRGAGWLSLEQNEGVLTADQSNLVPVHIDATNLVEGVYRTYLPLINGDLSQSGPQIPIKLTVIGIPEIEVHPDSLDFGEVILGNSALDSLTLINAGTGTLTVNSIFSDNSIFIPEEMDIQVPPRDSVRIHLAFSPLELGTFFSTMTFDSDAGNVAVSLTGKGVINTAIEEVPEAIFVHLFPNPTTGLLQVQLEMEQPREIQLHWFNVLGQELEQRWLPSNSSISQSLDFRSSPKGVYWLILKDNFGWQTIRQVVIQ